MCSLRCVRVLCLVAPLFACRRLASGAAWQCVLLVPYGGVADRRALLRRRTHQARGFPWLRAACARSSLLFLDQRPSRSRCRASLRLSRICQSRWRAGPRGMRRRATGHYDTWLSLNPSITSKPGSWHIDDPVRCRMHAMSQWHCDGHGQVMAPTRAAASLQHAARRSNCDE